MIRSGRQIQGLLHDERLSSWRKYALLTVGQASPGRLLDYELRTGLLGGVPGALGLLLRRRFYRPLFAACGRGALIGRNVTLRGAGRIVLGNGVLIDENCVLDARGEHARITVGDGVVLSRNTILRARQGTVEIGAGSDIGCNCMLATDSRLAVGRDVLLAAYVYITAGGNHRYERRDRPIIQQDFDSKGGVPVGDGAWIGAHCTVMDGAQIGAGAIVGANSMVRGAIAPFAVAFGVPCRVQRQRPGGADGTR